MPAEGRSSARARPAGGCHCCQPAAIWLHSAAFGHRSDEVLPSPSRSAVWWRTGRARPPIGRPPRAHGGIPMARRLDATQVVRPTHFGHAVLRTRNLDEAIAWWETVIGMQVVHRNAFI